jgi:hypothetical protein
MTENVTMTDHAGGASEPLAARIRDLLRRYNPIYLAPLAVLSLFSAVSRRSPRPQGARASDQSEARSE